MRIFLVCVFPHSFADYLQAIQATSVLACVFAILALFVFVAQLFTLPKGQRFTFTGILQFLSCKLQGGKITTCYLKKSWIYYEGGCVMSAWVQMTTKETSVILGATMPNKELSVHTRTSIWEYDMDTFITWIEFIDCYYLLNYMIEHWVLLMLRSLHDVVTLPCPAGLCIMIAASIYTAELHISEAVGGYGHCYILAWISFVFTFILAITYLILRKKSEWRERREGSLWLCFQFEFGIVNKVRYKLWKRKC